MFNKCFVLSSMGAENHLKGGKSFTFIITVDEQTKYSVFYCYINKRSLSIGICKLST